MYGMQMPNFPGLNGLPPNFQSPQTSSASSASNQMAAAAAAAAAASTVPKKPGKWCAMHVRIAWEIYHHQQRQQQQSSAAAAAGSTPESMKLGDFSGLS